MVKHELTVHISTCTINLIPGQLRAWVWKRGLKTGHNKHFCLSSLPLLLPTICHSHPWTFRWELPRLQTVSVWNRYARQQEWKPLIGGKQGSPLLFGVYTTLQTNRSACHCGIFLPICPLPTPFTNLLSITSIYQGQLLVKWDQR